MRFEQGVLDRLTAFVKAHRELTLSSASNRLVDEALRMHEHPLIAFKDGPAGRAPGWSAVPTSGRSSAPSGRSARPSRTWRATRSSRSSRRPRARRCPSSRAALAYWGDFPEEVDAFLDRARAEAAQARASWERQQELLGR